MRNRVKGYNVIGRTKRVGGRGRDVVDGTVQRWHIWKNEEV